MGRKNRRIAPVAAWIALLAAAWLLSNRPPPLPRAPAAAGEPDPAHLDRDGTPWAPPAGTAQALR